jgi:pyridoxal 5-phosphate dependent beta-lyase
MPALAGIELGEANVAARVGFAAAVGEYLSTGPESVRRSLAALGAHTRAVLADIAGWRVVEPEDEPTAITTLEPTGGADPVAVRERLLAEHAVVTTAAGVARAPGELTGAVLRISPHVDATPGDIEILAAALRATTR